MSELVKCPGYGNVTVMSPLPMHTSRLLSGMEGGGLTVITVVAVAVQAEL